MYPSFYDIVRESSCDISSPVNGEVEWKFPSNHMGIQLTESSWSVRSDQQIEEEGTCPASNPAANGAVHRIRFVIQKRCSRGGAEGEEEEAGRGNRVGEPKMARDVYLW